MNDCLVLFFPPGLGGHHLANILSTSNKYPHDINFDDYFSKLTTNAHYYRFDEADDSQSIVLAPHFGNANDTRIRELQATKTVEFLLIHFPNLNQLAWRRYNSFNAKNRVEFESMELYFVRHDLEKIYKQQFLSQIYGGVWNTVMADDLFSPEIDKILDQLEQNLSIKFLDRPLVKKIHTQWLDNIVSNLAKKDMT